MASEVDFLSASESRETSRDRLEALIGAAGRACAAGDSAEAARLLDQAAGALVALETAHADLRRSNEALRNDLALQRDTQSQLEHDALHDPLTGLPNRHLLMDRLEGLIKRAHRDPSFQFCVFFLDLDDFKIVNDTYGHRLGDALLCEVSRRLGEVVRDVDSVVRGEETAARLGGDEFIVLLEGLGRPEDAVMLAERMQVKLAEPMMLEGHALSVSASIGVMQSSVAWESAEDLIRHADTAMYRAKQGGKGRHALFNPEMHAEATRRLNTENELRAAVDAGELRVDYLPIVDLESGVIVAFEALMRWQHPTRGLVPPDAFLPIAEETGMIVDFGRWILREACGQARAWDAQCAGHPAVSVHVNVAERQLRLPGFVEEVMGVLAETGLAAERLSLEINESVIIEAQGAALEAITALRGRGVKVLMDDFGTGYSSLACLQEMPVDGIKIDHTFAANFEKNAEYAAIVNAIITMARTLNLRVTTEGLETIEHLAQVQSLGCAHGQGWFFSKPVSAEAASAMLREPPVWHSAAA